MKKSSQKPINGTFTGKPEGNGQPSNAKFKGTSQANYGRFTGMSDNFERLEPEIIPGYKVRG